MGPERTGSALASAKELLAGGRWDELLVLCRGVGLRSPQFAIPWLTAACAVDGRDEITALLARIGELGRGDPAWAGGAFLARLVAVLEATNHPLEAGGQLLRNDDLAPWSAGDLARAGRLARLVEGDRPQLAAELLLRVALRSGWEAAECGRAGRLADRLAESNAPLAAALLLAIDHHGGWTDDLRAVAGRVAGLIDDAALAEELRGLGGDAAASVAVLAGGPFRFADAPPADADAFLAPGRAALTLHDPAGRLAACRARFAALGDAFAAAFPPPAPPTVFLVPDAYVNDLGQIWTAGGLIVNKVGRPIADLRPEGVPTVEHATTVATLTTGIYHWMAQTLPAASWIARPEAAAVRLLVPAAMPAFKAASLHLGGIDDGRQEPLPAGGVVRVAHLHLASRPNAQRFLDQGNTNLFFTQDFYAALQRRALAAADPSAARPARLYVSRRDSTRRVLQNEAEVEAALAARGFAIVRLSGLPLAEQIALFAAASLVVSPHGGGLVQLLFCRPGTTVVELLPATDQLPDRALTLRFNFARIALMKGLRHHLLLAECHPTRTEWSVDCAPLLRLVDSLT